MCFYLLSLTTSFIPVKILPKKNLVEYGTMVLAFVSTVIMMLSRGIDTSKAPFQTLYESLILFSSCICFIYLVFSLKYKISFLNGLVALVSFSVLLYATLKSDSEITFLPPALQSFWFVPHVLLYFIAYGLLTFSCLLSMHGLLKHIRKKGEISVKTAKLSYTSMFIGLIFLTFGLITGSIWAQRAWGDYWSWDPKENWALISWLIYLIIIHQFKSMKNIRKMFTVLNIVAYASVLFTYLGIQTLPTAVKSKHIYKEALSEKPQRKPVS